MHNSERSHYEVLGVADSATDTQLRRAYLDAARRCHPDVAGAAGEEQMRRVNEAWAVLSDAEARALYDLTRPVSAQRSSSGTGAGAGRASGYRGPTPPPRINNPEPSTFVPKFELDEDDDDSWRYEPDPIDEATALSPNLQLIPPSIMILGFVLGIVGTVIAAKPLVAVGVAFVVMGGVGFLALPILAMGKAKAGEQRTQSR